MEAQRRHFEAQFGSLNDIWGGGEEREGSSGKERKEKRKMSESDEGSEGSDEESEGSDEMSDESDSEESESNSEESDDINNNNNNNTSATKQPPKVVTISETPTPQISKKDQKLARAGRAPTIQELNQKQSSKPSSKKQKTSKEDQDNLENDVKLQRLLQESHILANNQGHSGADLTMQTLDYEDPTGKSRAKALTSRLRNLSATNSSNKGMPKKLESMPMAMRKGMIKSQQKKVQKYEKEAKDAGTVLSKVKRGELRDLTAGKGSTFASDRLGTGKSGPKRVRDRGLKVNSVGKSTRNGLVILKKDIERINRR